MRAAASRWARIGVPLLIACGCGPRSLAQEPDAGGPGSVGTPADAGPATSMGDGGGGIGGAMGAGGMGGAMGAGGIGVAGAVGTGRAGTGGTGRAGTGGGGAGTGGTGGRNPLSCPPIEAAPPVTGQSLPSTRTATPFPTYCNPFGSAFFFPTPPAGTTGPFRRCASFQMGAVEQLAVSPDGGRVALVPDDGIVRVIDVASHQAIAALASPRATIDFAAFSPDGHAILTLATGEREVTLWGSGSLFARTWTQQLTGARYQQRFGGGGLAFSPDGRSAIVSAGQETFLLDVASGAVRNLRPPNGALLRLGYGWGGRRIIVAEGSTASDCTPGVSGGTVTVLDADTLADVAEVADLGGRFDARGYLGLANFAASPTDDLVLVPSSVGEPSGLRAFRLSDGTALPAPGLATLPLMFMPDGAHVLMRASGKLIVADGDSGAVLTSIADDGTAPVAVSPDGRTVAIGGRGQSLLRVWNLADPAPSAVCSVDDPGPAPTSSGPGVSLSGDGLLIAFGTGPHLRVANTNDGVVPVSFDLDDPSQGAHVLISPMKRHVATGPWPTSAFPTIVFGLQDHGRVADLPADGWRWGDLAFSPLEQQMYAIAHGTKEDRLYVASLDAPGLTSVGSFTGDYFSLLGVSQGCPVLYTGSRGAWRACGTCSDPPIGGGGAAVLSPDGGLVAMGAASPGPDVTLWPMQAGATALATFAASAADIIYQPLIQVPIAIATSGGRIVTSATSAQTCYRGPSLPVRIRDMTTGVFLDALPPVPGPGGLAVDRDIHRIAYGPQLWCSD